MVYVVDLLHIAIVSKKKKQSVNVSNSILLNESKIKIFLEADANYANEKSFYRFKTLKFIVLSRKYASIVQTKAQKNMNCLAKKGS